MSKKTTPATASHEDRLVAFQEQAIRRTWHEDQWWFSVIDVVAVLSESRNANRYWSDLRRKLAQEAGSEQPYEKIVRLKLVAPDGKQRETDCADTETLFRIVQSIPSPKAEPFKRWLAQVGYERVKEIEDPELASARVRALYEAKGYPKDWIEKRLRSIAVRGALTDEWKHRGVKEGREYAILTAEIAKRKDAQGFQQNKTAAKEGGAVAGNARKELEAKSGKPALSSANYLTPQDATDGDLQLSGAGRNKPETGV